MGLDSNLPVAWIFQRKSGVRTNSELFVRFRRKNKKISCRFGLKGKYLADLSKAAALSLAIPALTEALCAVEGLVERREGKGRWRRIHPWGRFVYLRIHEWLLFLDGKCSEKYQLHGWYGYGWSCWSDFFHLWSFEIWWVLSYWV